MLRLRLAILDNGLAMSRDRLIMNHNCQTVIFNWNVLRSIGLILAVFVLLQGCASNQLREEEIKEVKSEKPVAAEVSSETRADFKVAMDFIQAEEYAKGIELLKKVAKDLPNNAIPEVNLSIVYMKLDKLKLAEESLNLALKVDPENPVANNEYALLYRKTGRFKEARGLYEKILDKYPNFIIVHKNLGILCDMYMKDYECALKHYAFYSDVVQSDKTVKIWIADLQKRSGK